jgi:phosphoribosylaminoimidazole carboxylase (NCAIR synthetase)
MTDNVALASLHVLLCLCCLQDKFVQKQHFEAAGVPVAPYMEVADEAGLMAAAGSFGYPLMLKSKRWVQTCYVMSCFVMLCCPACLTRQD